MTNIKERLRSFEEDYRIGPVDVCMEAADHIQILETTHKSMYDHLAAQEKRIAELEAHIAQKAQSDKLDSLCDANPIIAAIRDEALADAKHLTNDKILSVCNDFISKTIMHPEEFWTYDHHLIALGRAVIDAMKAAK